jgi:hypothetical protein
MEGFTEFFIISRILKSPPNSTLSHKLNECSKGWMDNF